MSEESRIFVSLGANLDEPAVQLKEAVRRLKKVPGLHFHGISSFYLTEPLGPVEQPQFVNAVAEWRTRLSPMEILASILQVEEEMGRKRTIRWGPRRIDIDLLLYAGRTIESPGLRVPHPSMHERRFVLEPLAELAPEIIHPSSGKTAAQLLSELPVGGTWIKRLDEQWT